MLTPDQSCMVTMGLLAVIIAMLGYILYKQSKAEDFALVSKDQVAECAKFNKATCTYKGTGGKCKWNESMKVKCIPDVQGGSKSSGQKRTTGRQEHFDM
jgi:hypothetical protein